MSASKFECTGCGEMRPVEEMTSAGIGCSRKEGCRLVQFCSTCFPRIPRQSRELGDWLRGKRLEAGHTLRTMSRALGIRASELSAYERGRQVPQGLLVPRYARALGLDPMEFGRRLVREVDDEQA